MTSKGFCQKCLGSGKARTRDPFQDYDKCTACYGTGMALEKYVRIFDSPNAPHYGPIRRQWVRFAGMGLLKFADEATGGSWDRAMADTLNMGTTEETAAQANMWIILNAKIKELTDGR